MNDVVRTQVLIVGAGPTGLTLACQLARYGVDFVIAEKNAAPTPYSRALGVHARTLEIYDQFGIAEEAVARGAIAGKVRFLVGGTVRGEADLSHLGEDLSPFPYVLVLEQSKNEELLHDHLVKQGHHVDWQAKLVSFDHDDDGVRATLRTPAGERVVQAQYLVGCDGARSPVRNTLGLEFPGNTFERMFYVADVCLDWAMSHEALHVCFAPNAFVLFFPMAGERRYRIVGVFPENFSKDEGEVLYEEIEARIKTEVAMPLDITDVRWFSVYKVHTRHAPSFRVGRCFLAGDAAHIHSPAGAQGMNTGIQDAYNLGWKLALVLQEQAHPRLLDTYNDERLANARRLLRTTDRLFQMGAGEGRLFGLARTRVFPYVARFLLSRRAVNRQIFPLLSQIGIHYRTSALSDHESEDDFAFKAGDRMPYVLIDGANLYHRLRAPTFHLLTFSEGVTPTSSAHDHLHVHQLPLSDEVADLFGTPGEFHVLLRPDHYIAWITHEAPQERLERYFARLQRGA